MDLASTPSAESSSYDWPAGLRPEALEEFWTTAEAQACALTLQEFVGMLEAVAGKLNYGLPPGMRPSRQQPEVFFRTLRLPELALAHACALGREPAWERFLVQYRTPLLQAAISITGSATEGHELAGSLPGELFGLRERDGERRSPLFSFTGRGSLLGWLRTTLAQRHVDRHRRTYRETPLAELDTPAADPSPAIETAPLTSAVSKTLTGLAPEDRFLLASYFLDRATLLQIARLLHVSEATISRRLKRLTADLRGHLLGNLQLGGLSRRAAEEALGTDPRDLELNLRQILQTSQTPPFQGKSPTPAAKEVPAP